MGSLKSEAVDIIQGLLADTLTNYRGKYFRLDHCHLFDRPNQKPAVVMAAGGPQAARLAGRKGDGLMVTEPRADLVAEFKNGGGSGPRYAEVALCCAAKEEDARETAHHYFGWSLTGWPVMAELPHDGSFAAAPHHIPAEAVGQFISCGPSAEGHLQAIDRYVQAGCDHVILLQIGPDQDYFPRSLRAEAGARSAQSKGCLGYICSFSITDPDYCFRWYTESMCPLADVLKQNSVFSPRTPGQLHGAFCKTIRAEKPFVQNGEGVRAA